MEHDVFRVSHLSDTIPDAEFHGQAVKTVAYLRVSTPQQDVRSQRLAILKWRDVTDAREEGRLLIAGRRSTTNPDDEAADVRFVKGDIARALWALRERPSTRPSASSASRPRPSANGCQGRTKTRPEWRRKIRPSGRPVACLKVAVRVG